jgi:hypothetical protein
MADALEVDLVGQRQNGNEPGEEPEQPAQPGTCGGQIGHVGRRQDKTLVVAGIPEGQVKGHQAPHAVSQEPAWGFPSGAGIF